MTQSSRTNDGQMIKEGSAADGVREEADRQGREAEIHRRLCPPARLRTVRRDLRQREGRGPGLAEGRGRVATGTDRGPSTWASDVREVRRGAMAAQPRAGADHPGKVYLLPTRTYLSPARPDSDSRHLSRTHP